MAESFPVYKDGNLVGFFDPAKAECLGETGSTFEDVNEAGDGAWTELRRLSTDNFALLERTWDEFRGVRYGPAQLISRQEAGEWLLKAGIRPPDDLLADSRLTDFTRDAKEPEPPRSSDDEWQSLALLLDVPPKENPTTNERNVNGCNEPRVLLRGRNEGPIVLGKTKGKLTTPQYNVVKALLDAADAGLTKDELVSKSRHEDARGILRRLAESDPAWKEVIHFAVQTGGGYRIK